VAATVPYGKRGGIEDAFQAQERHRDQDECVETPGTALVLTPALDRAGDRQGDQVEEGRGHHDAHEALADQDPGQEQAEGDRLERRPLDRLRLRRQGDGDGEEGGESDEERPRL
jgi:hypothetical protein